MYTSVRGGPDVAESPVKGGTGRRRAVGSTVVLLGLTSMFTDISSEMVAAILPIFLVSGLGFNLLAFGFVDGLYQGVTAFVRLIAGFASDRWQRPKLVATSGYALSAGCKLALLPISSLVGVSAVLAVDRTGKGLRTAPRDTLIAANSSPDAYGRAFGVHRTLDTAGAMLGPLIGFALLAAVPMGYDAVFVTSACFALVGLAIIVLFVPEHRASPTVAGRRASLRAALGLLRDRAFARLVIAAAALGLLTVSDGFLYLSLIKQGKIAFETSVLLFVATSAVYLLLAIPLGRLADRIGRRVVFVAGHVALLGSYAAVAGPLPGLTAAGACVALLGVYYAATDGVLAAAAAPLLPERLRSTGLAVLQTLVALARFGSSVVFGAVWTVWGLGWAYALVAAGLALALPVAAWLLRADRSG